MKSTGAGAARAGDRAGAYAAASDKAQQPSSVEPGPSSREPGRTTVDMNLPGGCIALHSPGGRELLAIALAEGHARPHAAMAAVWARQANRKFAGAQTAALMASVVTQRTVTEEEAAAAGCRAGVLNRAVINVDGITLEQHAQVLRCLGVDAQVVYAASQAGAGAAGMITALRTALRERGSAVSICYHMGLAGQVGHLAGHISPVTACAGDAVLVMDVWPDTEPVWISAYALWRAVLSVDDLTGRSRGWCIARRREPDTFWYEDFHERSGYPGLT